jgi:hypothetical protein
MFLFGRRKMRFGKRHVPTEPIKVVHLPNTGFGRFIRQSVSQSRNFLSLRYFTDITSNCSSRGFLIFASVRGMSWLKDHEISKECVASIFSVMALKDFTNFEDERL